MNLGENPGRRKSKVSYATVVDVGLGGPKPRTKVVGDGQLVSIPAPQRQCLSKEGTRKGRFLGPVDMVRL